ncbi:hypothetical protein FKM82_004463 [Ascaphus truei]
MHQASVSKKGKSRSERECSEVAVLPSQVSAAGTKVALPTPRTYTKPELATAVRIGAWTDWPRDWEDDARSQASKTAAGSRCPEDAMAKLLDQKERRSVLPLIKKGVGRDTGGMARNLCRFPDCPPALKPSPKRVRQKSKAFSAGEMTPWVRPSPSESSLTALLCSNPSPRPCTERLDFLPTARDTQPGNPESCSAQTLQLLREKASGKAKERGRAGVTKRRFMNKLHGMRLPPVPAVTELSFSRSFTFSFFELPEHQSQQHWLQRQRLVYVTMRQLHY